MLSFKKVDAYAQVLLIVAGIIFSIVMQNDISILNVSLQGDVFFLSYFVVGGWQVLSALIHLFGFNTKPKLEGRKWYLFTLLFLVITGLLSIVTSDLVIVYLFGLLFISPLLAVWYCVICFLELRLWEQYKSPAVI